MKYGELTLGQIEAIVNKLGGIESVRRFLSGEMAVSALGKPFVTLFLNPAKPFVRDMAKEGWKLLEDVKYEAGEVQLELAAFLKPGEGSVKGDVMVQRAKEMGANLGQKHAELLLENQHLIPKEYRQYYLAFPGTFWQDSHGYREVPYLYWDSEQWDLNFDCLEDDCDSSDRLLRLCK